MRFKQNIWFQNLYFRRNILFLSGNVDTRKVPDRPARNQRSSGSSIYYLSSKVLFTVLCLVIYRVSTCKYILPQKSMIINCMINLQQVGMINRKQFVITEEIVLDILNQRLQDEKDISIRRYIQQKINLFR
jgi:hypothetical protein